MSDQSFFDLLSFAETQREGGGGKTERFYYDFTVNGRMLSEIIVPGDFITPFGWLGAEWDRKFAEQLLLRTPSELESGRVPLYICPECGDLGCGCVSVQVIEYDDCFVWSEFGFENNYDERLVESYPKIRDFVFEKASYYNALRRFGLDVQ